MEQRTLLEDGKWIWSLGELEDLMKDKYPNKKIEVELADKQYKVWE